MLTSIAQLSKRSFSSSAARAYFAKGQILGRVGVEPEESLSASGRRYVKYPVAVQTNKDYPPHWFNVVVFNDKQVDFVSNYVKKGSLVYLDVALNQDQYEREDGSKGSVVSLVQTRIDLLSSPRAVQEEDDE